MRRTILILAAGAVLLAGCASTVQKSDQGAPAPVIVKAAGKTIVLDVTGSTGSTTAKDWRDFKKVWSEQCAQEFGSAGAVFAMQEDYAQPAGGASGTLVVVNVVDYRYISTGARIMFGIMTGNAYINAEVTFRDLASGEVRVTKKYDTSSTAWQGIFSGMTTKQVHAMCHEILGEIGAS